MRDDRERGSGEEPANQPGEASEAKQREALGRFAKYTAPTMLALLVSDKTFAATTTA
jgi:hypothetical protein